MKKSLKLGTRRSLLAWAQSSWVAREVERLNPGICVELVGIETRGDRIQDVPLSSVQGKEFFVAEIDEALRSGAVDFTVHSMKDLSLERPAELQLAAIPRRENPRDVILFGPEVMERLRRGARLRIGTSSPRRLENIPGFARRALPRISPNGGLPDLEFVEIRGNVNSRLARVQEKPGAERHLDGVVLAFAGLIRLWHDEAGRAELRQLLRGVSWMVLPLKQCPAAPAQGALAIECRAGDSSALEAINKLHDDRTAALVARERQLLAEWGGGCHQRFGATAIGVPGLGDLMYVRGKKPCDEASPKGAPRDSDDAFVDELRWDGPIGQAPTASVREGVRAWDGVKLRESLSETLEMDRPGKEFENAKAVFVAHARALRPALCERSKGGPGNRLWTSGVESWFKLAAQGLWVEGSAEGLGFESLRDTLRESVLELPPLQNWLVLTHSAGEATWPLGEVLVTYRVAPREDAVAVAAIAELKAATHVFWGSSSQFERLGRLAAPGAHHACGPGKTRQHLVSAGVERVSIFPTVEEWRTWIQKNRGL